MKDRIRANASNIKGFEQWLNGRLPELFRHSGKIELTITNPIFKSDSVSRNIIDLDGRISTAKFKVTTKPIPEEDILVFGIDLSNIDLEFTINITAPEIPESCKSPFYAKDFVKFFSYDNDNDRRKEAERLLKDKGFDFNFIGKFYDDILEFFNDFVVGYIKSVRQSDLGGVVVDYEADSRNKVKSPKGIKLIDGVIAFMYDRLEKETDGLRLSSDKFTYLKDRKFLPMAFGLLYEPENVGTYVKITKDAKGGLYVIDAYEVDSLASFSKFRNKRIEREIGVYCSSDDSVDYVFIAGTLTYNIVRFARGTNGDISLLALKY